MSALAFPLGPSVANRHHGPLASAGFPHIVAPSPGAAVNTWITLSVVALLPILLRTRKLLMPMRVSASDPWRMAGGYRRYKIQTFTGRASGVTQRGDAYTSINVGSRMGADGQIASVHGTGKTTVVVVDTFFLTDGIGETRSYQLAGFNAAVGEGHTVSVASVSKGRAKKGRYFMVYNHTTRQAFFSNHDIRKALTFPFPPLYIAALTLMILPIPVLVFFGLVDIWQVARFKKAGVRPLVTALEKRAQPVPIPA